MKQIIIFYSDGEYSYRDETFNSKEFKDEYKKYLIEVSDEVFELWESISKAYSVLQKQLAKLDNDLY